MIGLYLSMLDTAREKSKFEKLYRTYRQDMFKTAFGILKNTYEAEDAVHEAFMIVIKKLNKIPETNNYKTHAFLIIIVKNIALNFYNKYKNENLYGIDDIEISDYENIEDIVIEKMETEQFEKILKQLPENYYNIIFLEQYLGLTITDIAECLGITYENAKKRLQRAKKKLKQLIEDGKENE